MSDLGEVFKVMKETSKIKRNRNHESSMGILWDQGIEFKVLSDTHLRVGEYDFWPSTGLFIHVKTKKRGRGVFNLIKKIKKE